MKPYRASSAILAMLTILLLVSCAYAAYSTAFIYTKFITTDTYAEALDKTYHDLTLTIKNRLTYADNSNSSYVKLANTTDAVKRGIAVVQKKPGLDENLYVYVFEGVTEIEIAKGKWNEGETVTVRINNGKISVKVNQTTLVEGFSYSIPEGYSCIAAHGCPGTGVGAITGGYVQVDISEGFGTGVLMDFLPAVVALALVGMLIGMVKKIGR